MSLRDDLTDYRDICQNKIDQLKELSIELEFLRNELCFTIKACEEIIRKGSTYALKK